MPSFDVTSLSDLKRRDLQALAKSCGIKANSKTLVIIAALEAYHAAYSKAAVTTAPDPTTTAIATTTTKTKTKIQITTTADQKEADTVFKAENGTPTPDPIPQLAPVAAAAAAAATAGSTFTATASSPVDPTHDGGTQTGGEEAQQQQTALLFDEKGKQCGDGEALRAFTPTEQLARTPLAKRRRLPSRPTTAPATPTTLMQGSPQVVAKAVEVMTPRSGRKQWIDSPKIVDLASPLCIARPTAFGKHETKGTAAVGMRALMMTNEEEQKNDEAVAAKAASPGFKLAVETELLVTKSPEIKRVIAATATNGKVSKALPSRFAMDMHRRNLQKNSNFAKKVSKPSSTIMSPPRVTPPLSLLIISIYTIANTHLLTLTSTRTHTRTNTRTH